MKVEPISRTDHSPHTVELQSLRGIAATIVMVHHSFRTLEPDGWAWTASQVPLNAYGAVIVFFVLSGYVLSKSLLRSGRDARGVVSFYVRRVFRIYPALWIGLLLGGAYLVFVQPIEAPTFADWARAHYRPEQLGWRPVAESIAGLGNYLLPTSWTITVELCASLVLPGLVWLFIRYRALTLPTILLLALVSAVSGPALRNVPFYLFDFALGAAIACFPVTHAMHRARTIMLTGATAILLFAELFPMTGPWYWGMALVQGVAAAALVGGLAGGGVGWLRHRSLAAIGDWSYSIYLLHLPITFTVTRLLDHAGLVGHDRNLAAIAIAVLTAALTLPLSAVVFRYVELPGIALGRTILHRWNARR